MSNKVTLALLAAALGIVGWTLMLVITEPIPDLAKEPIPDAVQEIATPATRQIAQEKNNSERYKRGKTKRDRAGDKKQKERKPIKEPAKPAIALSEDSEFTPEEQKIVDTVQSALDDDNFEATKKAVARLAQAKNPALRMKAVEAIGWFGKKGDRRIGEISWRLG